MPLAFLSVLLVLWPFHHKTPTYSTGTVSIPEFQPTERQCYRDEDADYLYLGRDEMIGVSDLSCEDAYQIWRHTYSKLPANNRT